MWEIAFCLGQETCKIRFRVLYYITNTKILNRVLAASHQLDFHLGGIAFPSFSFFFPPANTSPIWL